MAARLRARVWCLASISAAILVPASVQAQLLRPPAAEVTPLVAADGTHRGADTFAAVRVVLPEGLHVNSNQPRDPSLIPIVLTVDPSAGVSVAEIVYPEATDLVQQGADEPLAVYERDFVIGVRLSVAADAHRGRWRWPLACVTRRATSASAICRRPSPRAGRYGSCHLARL
jgi:hypothetical protein